MRNAEIGMRNTHRGESVPGAAAPSPPSEEGGGAAWQGLKRRDGRRESPDQLMLCAIFIKMCAHSARTLTLLPKAAKHNPPKGGHNRAEGAT